MPLHMQELFKSWNGVLPCKRPLFDASLDFFSVSSQTTDANTSKNSHKTAKKISNYLTSLVAVPLVEMEQAGCCLLSFPLHYSYASNLLPLLETVQKTLELNHATDSFLLLQIT